MTGTRRTPYISEETPFDTVEALCQHHDVTQFTVAEKPDYEQWLVAYWERSTSGVGDRVLVAVLRDRVRGFIASMDVTLNEPDGYEGVYFYFAAAAVDDEARGGPVLTALAKAGLGSVNATSIAKGVSYRGMLATPHDDEPLRSALEAIGFHRLPGESPYWAKLLVM